MTTAGSTVRALLHLLDRSVPSLLPKAALPYAALQDMFFFSKFNTLHDHRRLNSSDLCDDWTGCSSGSLSWRM